MRKLWLFLVCHIFILGSGSATTTQTSTAAEDNNTSTSTVAKKTVSMTAIVPYSTNGSFPTHPSSPSSLSTRADKSTSVGSSPTASGVSQTISMTTMKPGPWKVVTFALSGVSAALLLGLLVVIIILCKMRTKLRQASKTLYPITPSKESHEYYDLEDGKTKNKKGLKVELKHMTVHHEEEFDSPTISPTPPVSPRRDPPAVPDSSEAPKVPTRSKNKPGKLKMSAEKRQSTSDGKVGATNPGFVNDGANQIGTRRESEKSTVSEISLYNDEETGDLYESYDNTGGGGRPSGVFAAEENEDIDDFDAHRAYEEPVKTLPGAISATSQFLNRQGSTSGLPDSTLPKIASKESMSITPLQDVNEDADDMVHFGAMDPDSGLPNMTGMPAFDEDEFFDDPEKMTAQETEVKQEEDDTDVTNVPDGEQSMDDALLAYDDADMAFADKLALDEDEEPGFYEDYHMSNRSEEFADIPSSTDDQAALPTSTNRSRSTTEDSGLNNDDAALPKVPPRRDLIRKQSEGENSTGNFNDMVLPGIGEQEADNSAENDVQLRLGRQVSAQGQTGPRDSYYLFMDDKTRVLNDTGTDKLNLNIDDLVMLSGLSGTSEISVDLHELPETDNGLISRPESNNMSGEKAFFDMHTDEQEPEDEKHVNGRIPNTDVHEWMINSDGHD